MLWWKTGRQPGTVCRLLVVVDFDADSSFGGNALDLNGMLARGLILQEREAGVESCSYLYFSLIKSCLWCKGHQTVVLEAFVLVRSTVHLSCGGDEDGLDAVLLQRRR